MEIERPEAKYDSFSNNRESEIFQTNAFSWTTQFTLPQEEALHCFLSLKADPLLSQAQIDENSLFNLEPLEDAFPKKPACKIEKPKVVKSKRPNILKSINKNKKTDYNMNNVGTTREYKGDVLNCRKAVALEMVFIRNGIGLFIKDEDMTQLFVTQHIKLAAIPSQKPVRHQFVRVVNLLPLCEKANIKLPQLVTNIGTKVHLCPLLECSEAFLQSASAKSHALKHLGVKPYKCTFSGCMWQFANHSRLQRHIATHDSQNKKRYLCEYNGCNRVFTTIYNLKEHKKKHLKPASKYCPVQDCDLIFHNEKQVASHCAGAHSEAEAPFKCDNCNKRFFFPEKLQVHMKAHLSDHVCPYKDCGKSYSVPYRLKEHIRTHTGHRPYGCTHEGCTWRFTTASKLKRHQRVHVKERKYQCTEEGCDKAFKRSENLRDHLRAHADAKPPKTSECEVCGMEYNSNVAHMKNCGCLDGAAVEQLPSQLSVIQSQGESHITLQIIETIDQSEIPTIDEVELGDKSEEELLEAAIKSLGMPEMNERDELITVQLTDEDFSTVNLKDLD